MKRLRDMKENERKHAKERKERHITGRNGRNIGKGGRNMERFRDKGKKV